MKASVIATFFGVLLTCTYAAKEATKKTKKAKLYIPQIDCDVKAGKIINPEFIAKCPPGCQDVKYRVYGTDIYASFSSVCSAAIHSGAIDNTGGKILVQKVAGHAGYRGSFSNGVRSLSLPRWRESFLVSEGKPRKGVTYPSTLEFASSKSTAVKPEPKKPEQDLKVTKSAATSDTSGKAWEQGDTVRKVYQTSPVPMPTTQMAATTPTPTTTTTDPFSTTPKPTTTPATTRTTTDSAAAKPRPGLQRVRDTGSSSVHPAYSSVAAAASTIETDLWKPGLSFFDTGFASKEELNLKPLEATSQGNPSCKVDLSFLMDGSWSIGKRRFQLQKQFLINVAHALGINNAGPLMGIVQYGDDPSTEFNLKTYASPKELRNAIEKIPQKGGLSNVGKALSFVNKNFFSDANGNRGGAPNVVVVMVDGWPTDRVEEASRLARESGINIFFVTIEAAAQNEKQNVIEPNFVDKAVCRTNGFYSITVPSWFSLHKVVQPLVKRVCDIDRLVCSKTCLNSADIGFVIDGSSSVGTGNFRTVLQFVANISKEFEISDTDTRIGAIQYTYEQRLEFSFDKYSTKQDVLSAIKRINYWSGGTSTGAAISYASEQLFTKSKPNKRKIMILITDGRSYDDVRMPALTAHQNGVIAYSIGVAWAAQDELEAIATDPDKEHSFFVDEFDNLYQFVNPLIQNICTEFNSQPRN
uniref:Vitrin n=1 Tax=Gallus gallus TaxID=9031 RepID=A0A8V0Y0X0_CHICK